MRDLIEYFRRAFFRWVEEHNKPSKRCPAGYKANSAELFELLRGRTPDEYLRRIGGALEDKWLETESAPERTYYIRERGSDRSGQPTVYHQGNGQVIPWWELYIQLADYALLRSVAERLGLVVRMEEEQMDINVWAGSRLLLFVENKTTREKAMGLLNKMRSYGETGFDLDAIDKGNDPLRKAKYLFRNEHHPQYFALSAVGCRQLFAVEYLGEHNRFRLNETAGDITTPLLSAEIVGTPPERGVADSLAIEFQRLLAESGDALGLEAWMSPGTRGTSFNLYVLSPETKKHAIIAGVYKNGEIWTDVSGLGRQLAGALSARLDLLGITLDSEKHDAFWKKGGPRFVIQQPDAVPICEAVVETLGQPRAVVSP